MIEVAVSLDKGLTEVKIAGHATGPGGDIICAAVSAIISTALLGLQATAEKHPDEVRVTVNGQ